MGFRACGSGWAGPFLNSELSCARVMLCVLKGTLFKPPTLTPTSDEATSDEARSLLKSLAKSLIKLNIAEAVLARRLSKQRKRSLLLNSMAAFRFSGASSSGPPNTAMAALLKSWTWQHQGLILLLPSLTSPGTALTRHHRPPARACASRGGCRQQG